MSKSPAPPATEADDLQAQIRQLRAQLDGLMAERVEPLLRDAADQIGAAADKASGFASDELEALARQVRARPIASLAAAAALGFVAARLLR